MEDKKARIVIVDDEPEIVEALKHFLSGKGYEAVGAFSGEEALNILEKDKADLILLDMMMPGIKGSEVAQIVKRRYPQVKVIVVTGYPTEGAELAKTNLLEGMFVKPIRIQEVYDKLVEVLGQKETTSLDTKVKQGIQARVLLVHANLLLIEEEREVTDFLTRHFQDFARKGENYVIETVEGEEEIKNKISGSSADILIVNADIFKKNANVITQAGKSVKEIIIYSVKENKKLAPIELEKLTHAVQAACFKNGLIEIKWVEI